jgi:hypothetical protein
MAKTGDSERELGRSSHRNRTATSSDELEEAQTALHLDAGRRPVRRRRPRMRRNDIPEQNVVGETEPSKDALHDGRGRLGGTRTRQLSLGGEGEARDSCPTIPGRLADEERLRVRA